MWDNLILDILDVGLHFPKFETLKFSDKKDEGPGTRTHTNGNVYACKCTEIFNNNLHSRVSKG